MASNAKPITLSWHQRGCDKPYVVTSELYIAYHSQYPCFAAVLDNITTLGHTHSQTVRMPPNSDLPGLGTDKAVGGAHSTKISVSTMKLPKRLVAGGNTGQYQ